MKRFFALLLTVLTLAGCATMAGPDNAPSDQAGAGTTYDPTVVYPGPRVGIGIGVGSGGCCHGGGAGIGFGLGW